MPIYALARVWGWRLMFCVAASLVGNALKAQPASPEDGAAAKMVADYVKAWNSGDVEALGRMWMAEGEMIDPQGVIVDRKALLANKLAEGDGPRPVLSIVLDKVRLLGPNVVMVDGESTLTTPEGSVLRQTRFSGVLIKQDGGWRIRLIRQLSTRQSQPGESSPPAEPLKDLAWNVGEWVGMGNGMRVHNSAKWDLGKRYIVYHFEYEPEHGDAFEAEVRAGWDPETRSIKSWYFDSRGGVSTTIWAKSGGHWLGTTTGTQNDGESFTGSMAITQVDNDSYLRTMSNVKVGGKAMPDQELRMFRVPEQPVE